MVLNPNNAKNVDIGSSVLLPGKRVEKPWGYEIWWAHTDRYVGKILSVNKGSRLSLQYHLIKDETLMVLSGVAKITVGAFVVEVSPMSDAIHIKPNTVHRIEAVTDVVLVEVSTPEVDDVVRLEDDYGRQED